MEGRDAQNACEEIVKRLKVYLKGSGGWFAFVKTKVIWHVPEESEILVGAGGVPANGLVWYLVELVRREVGGVRDRAEAGNERSVNVPDACPVDPVKERMVLDLVDVQTAVGGRDQPGKVCMSREPALLGSKPDRRMRSSASRLRCTSSGNIK